MEFRDLNIFYQTAKLGNMSLAAKALGYVQSHVTTRIRHLEQEVGHRLFERSKKGVTLTPEGRRFFEQVEKLLQMWQTTQQVLRTSEPQGILRIGSMETTSTIHLPRWLVHYHRMYPKVDVHLKTGHTQELVEAVLAHQLDMAFVANPTSLPQLAYQPVVTETLLAITQHGRSLEEELGKSSPVIITFRPGCTYRQLTQQWLLKRGISSYRSFECGSVEAILQLVAGGLGLSVMPQSVIGQCPYRHQLATFPLQEIQSEVTTYAVWRKSSTSSIAVQKLVEIAKNGKEGSPHCHMK